MGDALLAPSMTRRLIERFAPSAPAPPAVHGVVLAYQTGLAASQAGTQH